MPKGDWIQFSCDDCVILELHYQDYLKYPMESDGFVEILSGRADF